MMVINTVLVIDDEAPMRKMIRTVLEAAHYGVIEAPDGVTGVRLFRKQNPQLVITEILMPEKEGIKTIRQIRQMAPWARIVAISGGGRFAWSDFLPIAKRLGALETLRKPFRRNELLACVERALVRVL